MNSPCPSCHGYNTECRICHGNVVPRGAMNSKEGARLTFGGGRATSEFSYLGAPIEADFELSYENLAPFVVQVLDLAAPIEDAGRRVDRVEIKNGTVRVTPE
jgi:hypothetical protein